MDEEKVARLVDVILTAMNGHSEVEQFTTGEAISALFALMVASARASPTYNAEAFMDEVNANLEMALGTSTEKRDAHERLSGAAAARRRARCDG